MILLSFTSAAIYILSLMLAMLGIISFEEVRPPSGEPVETVNAVDQKEMLPLGFMPQKTYSGPDFFNSYDLKETQQEILPLRNDYPMEIQVPERQVVYTVHYQSVIEKLRGQDALQKRLVILCKDAINIAREDIVLIQSGI